MLTADFDFALPDELIAQQPAPRRDASRLLVLRRQERQISHQTFPDLLQHLRAGDVLVLNNSKVIPARLHAVNPETGGILEILLLEENSRNDWWAMMRPGKRAPVGREFILMDRSGTRSAITVTVRDTNDAGHRRLEFSGTPDIGERLDEFGELPLPPYIQRAAHQLPPEDDQRYQTVYARDQGSVAAPTAGLHFTEELLAQIRARGVEVCYVTLHVGLGTFAPVKVDQLADHAMHYERFHVAPDVAEKINAAKVEQRRVCRLGLIGPENVAGVRQHHQPRPGDRLRDDAAVVRRDELVGLAVDHQHRHCETGEPIVTRCAT